MRKTVKREKVSVEIEGVKHTGSYIIYGDGGITVEYFDSLGRCCSKSRMLRGPETIMAQMLLYECVNEAKRATGIK